MKRKLTAVILCLVMALAFAAPVYAADGDIPAIVITGFTALEPTVAAITADVGTGEGALNLPTRLDAAPSSIEEGVTWACTTPDTGYNPDVEGAYVFTPTLPAGYTLAPDVAAPAITVTLAAPAPAADNAAIQAAPALLQAPATPTYQATTGEIYHSLAQAIQHAPDGQITLAASGTEAGNVTLSGPGDCILHMNGNSLTFFEGLSVTRGSITMEGYGTLTFNASGTALDVSGNSALTIQEDVAASAIGYVGVSCWDGGAVNAPTLVAMGEDDGVQCHSGGSVLVHAAEGIGPEGAGVNLFLLDTDPRPGAVTVNSYATGAVWGVSAQGGTVNLGGSATGGSFGIASVDGAVVNAASATGYTAVSAESGGAVNLTGDANGQLYGIYADRNSTVTAQNATAALADISSIGAYAYGSGAAITLSGDATGYGTGVRADSGTTIAARNATATSLNYSLPFSSVGAISTGTGHIQLSGEARGYNGATANGLSATLVAATATATGERGVALAAIGDGLGPHQTRPDVGYNAIVTGAVTGVNSGVVAQGNMWVQVGSVSATGNAPRPDTWTDNDGIYWRSRGVFNSENSRVHVSGDINCQLGIEGGSGEVLVGGSINATNLGVSAANDLTVTVEGTITSPTPVQFRQFDSSTRTWSYYPKTWADAAQGTDSWQAYQLFTDAVATNSVVRVRNLPPPASTQTTTITTSTTTASPKTGDPATALPLALAALSATGLGGVLALRRRKNSNT